MSSVDRVRRYYDETSSYEASRLGEGVYRRLERDMTMRTIARHARPIRGRQARILDAGGGPGAYLGPLVELGLDPWLCDLSGVNVRRARAAARALGLSDVNARVRRADATDLGAYARASFDGALALGPFYHLLDAEDRRRAISELARVVRPGGFIVFAILPRLHPLRYLLRESSDESFGVLEALDWDDLLATGRYQGDSFFTDAHLADLDDFRRAVRQARCRIVETLAVESFCSFMDVALEAWATTEERYAKVLELVERTARRPEQLGAAEHVLVVARTPPGRRDGPRKRDSEGEPKNGR